VDEQVEKGHKLTVADLQAIQGDTYNPVAAEVVPLLLQVKTDSSFGFTAQARDLLKDWNYGQQVDSPAAAYFNAVWFALLDLTFSDELPEGVRPDGGQRWFEVIRPLLKNPRNQWWDDRRTPDVVEAEAEVLRQAMIQARLRLTSMLGKDPKRWQWGQLHQVRLIGQPLGGLSSASVLHWLTNEGPIGVGGGSSVVNAMGWDAASGSFGVTEAPSLRMIVNLGDLDGSRWVNATGQSAHPGQGHYLDQLDDWVRNRTSGWPSSPEAVRKVTADTLTLKSPG
jgi:penicillin amidase